VLGAAPPLLYILAMEEFMEKQGNKGSSTSNKSASNTSKVQQSRGPELGEKMKESEKKGEQYRAQNQGADAFKQPGTSNSEKAHKH
jgi:hypothetical protein